MVVVAVHVDVFGSVALGTAKLDGRNWLEGRDFEQSRMGRSRKIGF